MAADPFLQRLSELSWPVVALDRPDPAPGQLWRAEWGGTACPVVVTGEREGRVVPVTAATADRIGDERGLVAESVNEMMMSVWGGVASYIKMFTLEYRITDLTSNSFDRLLAVADGQQQGDWAPISSDLDDRVLIRTDLSERLQFLSEAEWLPMASMEQRTIAELAEAAGIRTSQIADHLGITPGDARRLIRGQREPSADEIRVLSDLLGSVPEVSLQFDEDLVVSLDLPEFRPRLYIAARGEHRGDEVSARRALAGQMEALAARHRDRGPRNWVSLIREALRED